MACGKYFEAKHKGTTLIETELGGITHPNQFFEESVQLMSQAKSEWDQLPSVEPTVCQTFTCSLVGFPLQVKFHAPPEESEAAKPGANSPALKQQFAPEAVEAS